MKPNPKLLELPATRAAYSDRTAWLLSRFSELAYHRFEDPPERALDPTIELIREAEGSTEALQEVLIKFHHDVVDLSSEDLLAEELSLFGFELVSTFDSGGTQAYLAKRDRDKVAVVVFRGTEKDKKDIETDLNARFYESESGKVHIGFKVAFDQVAEELRAALVLVKNCQVFLTGHSLGGALAIIAARELRVANGGACYTFGSPKVGSDEFGDAIKMPIYRVVNAFDPVPRMPPTLA